MLIRTMMGVSQISATIKVFTFAALYVLSYANHEDYIGWKIFYVNTTTTEQVKAMNAIRTILHLDVVSPAHEDREAVVLVKPEYQEEFIKKLDHFGIKYRTHVNDIKTVLDNEDEMHQNLTKSITRVGGDIMLYNNYQRLKRINAYMEYIANKYRHIASLKTAAKTFEGRPINYMQISTTNFLDKIKPVIFIEGGMHAREWISPPTVTWAIKKLTENLTEPDLLRYFDWILMPVANPDGYEFTYKAKRLWRKNRSRNLPNNRFCPGVDCNRNFDIAWNTFDTESDPCSFIFPGKQPFSEIETQVIRDILHEHVPRIALYLSMHSYGNFIMFPWGHNLTRSYNYDALNTVGLAMADAFFNHGSPDFPRVVVGSTAEVFRRCSGTSTNYAHHIGVPLTFTYELPGLSPAGNDGFHLNPKYIEDVCRAVWAGIIVGARNAKPLL